MPEHIPNTASAVFHSRSARLPEPKPATVGVSYMDPTASPQHRNVPSHGHLFASKTSRLPERKSATQHVDLINHDGVGAVKATGGASAAFRARAPRMKYPEPVTKDVDVDRPGGVGDAGAKGVTQWHGSKSHNEEHKDESGFAPRFRSPKSATKDVVPHMPKGMGDVDASRPHPTFQKQRGGRFHSPKAVTANIDVSPEEGDHSSASLAHQVARGRSKGAALSRAQRFVEPKPRGAETFHVDNIGTGARAASAWSKNSASRFPQNKSTTANVWVDADKGMASKVKGGHLAKEERFKTRKHVTADVDVSAEYSTMGKSKGGVIHAQSQRFVDPKVHTKDCDYDVHGGMAGALSQKKWGAHSAQFKSSTDRFHTRAKATKDVEYVVKDGIADEVAKGKSKAGAHMSKSGRFRTSSTMGDVTYLNTDHPQSIVRNTAGRSHSCGAPGMRSRCPRFKTEKSQGRESEAQGPVRGMGYVISNNHNTFSSRH